MHWRINKLIRKIESSSFGHIYGYAQENVELRRALYLDKKIVLVHQMGKVGSSSVYRSLQNYRSELSVYHTHFLSSHIDDVHAFMRAHGVKNPHHLQTSRILQHHWPMILKRGVKLISLVRDPIAQLLSDLFQNPNFYGLTLHTGESEPDDRIIKKAVVLIEQLLGDYASAFEYLESWFDNEVRDVFGIDVFGMDFAKDVGWLTYHHNDVDLLVIRVEDLNRVGEKVISNYLDLERGIKLVKANVGSSKNRFYTQVLQQLCLSQSLVAGIYSERFTRQFYSDIMIQKFIDKWTRCGSPRLGVE